MNKQNSKFKWKHVILIAFLLMGVSQTMWSQKQTIKGTVISDNGDVLPGVSIVAKDVKLVGTATDFDGNFVIKVPSKVKSLIFSYLGFKTKVVSINGKMPLHVTMSTDSKQLEEVVIIGYGTQRRKDVTGAIASVKSEDLEKTVNQSIGDALQGRVAGLQVISEDGIPGGGFKINIRGAASISGSTEPLYVVDGFPIEVYGDNVDNDTGYEGGGSSSGLDFMDASLIESIEVLKDASATAIYGARGANGVIIITTKKGKAGKTKINYSVSTSLSVVPDDRIPTMFSTDDVFDYLNKLDYYNPKNNRSWNDTTQEWEYLRELSEFTLRNPYSDDEEDMFTREQWNNQLSDTDWVRKILKTGVVTNHSLSISGGNPGNLYNFSASYLKNEGVAVGSGYNRFVVNINLNNRLSDRLSVKTTISPSYSKQYGTGGGGGSIRNEWGLFSRAMNTAPYIQVGNLEGIEDEFDGNIFSDPVYQAENEISNTYKYGFRGMTKLTYKITDELSANVDFGIKYDLKKQRRFNPATFGMGSKPAIMGQAIRQNSEQKSYTNSNTLNYNKKFGKHRINAVIGFTQQSKMSDQITEKARRFDLDVQDGSVDFDLANFYFKPKIRIQEVKQNGLLSRVNYVFNNKYSVTGTLRRDGDSRFNKKNRYRYFPSASFAWTLSEEDFLKNSDVIDNWKLRLSYGKAGNSGTRPRDSREQFVVSNYTFGGKMFTGYGSKLLVDNELTWQSTLQYNAGMDVTLFGDRINLVVDAYLRKTIDMILDQPLPPNTGYAYMRTNSGDLDNWGYEFTLNTENIKSENFLWTTNLTFAIDRSKVLSLNGPDQQLFKTRLDHHGNSVALQVGENIGTWVGYQYEGVYKSWEEIEASQITKNIRGDNLQPGDPKYADMNGDNKINDEDITIIARTQPKFHGGIWNNFKIKNFELGLFFTYKYKFDVINGDKFKHTYHSRGGSNMLLASALDAWSPDNPNSNNPGFHFDTGAATPPLSSYHVEDGSFIRLQNVKLSYNIPRKVLEKSFIKSCKIAFNITNAYLWTKYSGSDPETSVSRGKYGNLAPNLDWGAYPRTRNWNTTLKIGF